ncbi:MAG: glucuronate isomerase [Gaiellaceae bacterium]
MTERPRDRYLSLAGAGTQLALELYEGVASLPIVSPHGHVDVAIFADPAARLDSPGRLFVTSDHYVTRMLYSQGVPLERLGLQSRHGAEAEVEDRAIWQALCDNIHLYRGTPTGLWLRETLATVFGVEERLGPETAGQIYDRLEEQLASPEFSPRALFERFGIETLATTDPAGSKLEDHKRLLDEGWDGRIRPTFRPDAVVDLLSPGWRRSLARLEEAADREIGDYTGLIAALEERRAAFRALGATATDHAATTAGTAPLSERQADSIFRSALRGTLSESAAPLFGAHMLREFARMSVDDGLVMQLRVGSLRDHNSPLARRFGNDIGGDIPIATDWTRDLRPLLNAFGNDLGFRLILSTLDESTYSRELAPLAGHYPAVRLGSPWWFHDSPEGMTRYLDRVAETAGIYNLAGFVDDAHTLPTIPARHDLWRRVTCAWLARKVSAGLIEESEAPELASELAYVLSRRAFRLEQSRR